MKYTAKDLSSLLTANDRQNRTYTEKDITPKMLSDFQKKMDKFLKEFPNYDIHNDEGDDKKADDAFIELFFDVIQDAGIDIFEEVKTNEGISDTEEAEQIIAFWEKSGYKKEDLKDPKTLVKTIKGYEIQNGVKVKPNTKATLSAMVAESYVDDYMQVTLDLVKKFSPETPEKELEGLIKDISAYDINGNNGKLSNIIKTLKLKDSDKIAIASFIKDAKINESKMKTKVNEAFVGDKVKTPSGKEGYITSITKEKTFVVTTDGKTEEIPAGESVEVTEATDYEENLPPRIPMFEDFKAARARKNKVNESLSTNDKAFVGTIEHIIADMDEAGPALDDIFSAINSYKSKADKKLLAKIEELANSDAEEFDDYQVIDLIKEYIATLK